MVYLTSLQRSIQKWWLNLTWSQTFHSAGISVAIDIGVFSTRRYLVFRQKLRNPDVYRTCPEKKDYSWVPSET